MAHRAGVLGLLLLLGSGLPFPRQGASGGGQPGLNGGETVAIGDAIGQIFVEQSTSRGDVSSGLGEWCRFQSQTVPNILLGIGYSRQLLLSTAWLDVAVEGWSFV